MSTIQTHVHILHNCRSTAQFNFLAPFIFEV